MPTFAATSGSLSGKIKKKVQGAGVEAMKLAEEMGACVGEGLTN